MTTLIGLGFCFVVGFCVIAYLTIKDEYKNLRD